MRTSRRACQMSHAETTACRLDPKPLPENLRGVQPGGGRCYQVELAWARLRRWWLRTFRKGYAARMADLREGSTEGYPHEILDPRDLKYCVNLGDCRFREDPFAWRERIPFARWGLAELQLMGWPLLAATIGLALTPWWYAALAPGVILLLVVWFFRDPPRRVPGEPGLLVSPADGTIAEITDLEHHDYIDGPAVRIGIFLSIFNVHINRTPCRARVIELIYSPGKFLNAMNPESALVNENLWIGLEEESPPHRRMVVRQISGLIARRIVCTLKPGEVRERGEKFGMIKLGSRTELILPKDASLVVDTQVGQKVKAGSTVLARWDAGAGDAA